MNSVDPLEEVRARWEEIATVCRRYDRNLGALLLLTRPLSVTSFGSFYRVTLETQFAQHCDQISAAPMAPILQNALAQVLGSGVNLDVQVKPIGQRGAGKGVNTPIISPRAARRGSMPFARGKIQAIPTKYGGYQMRSKLEADAAALFDRAGFEWEYEVQGFNMGGTLYLPDFVLYDVKSFVETKGVFDANAERKATKLASASEENQNGYTVLVLQQLRPRSIDGLRQRYVAATLASGDGQFFEKGAILARCPSCKRAQWKAPGGSTCERCGVVETPDAYQPIV